MQINDAMQARMALLKETGYNLEKAQKCWDFVRGGDEAKKQEPASGRLADGVYLIDTKGNAVRFDGEATESVNDTAYIGLVQGGHAVAIALHDVSEDEIKLLGGTVEEPKPAIQEARVTDAPDGVYLIYKDGTAAAYYPNNKPSAAGCVAVGLKMGSKRIAIDLHDFQDEAGNKDITLTTQKGDKDYSGYKDNYLDAGADWDGKGNTEHLKQIGLNPAIKLGVRQWIPALGELKFIQLFRKEVNEALEYAGGDALDPVWYWSSTERSATDAWNLHFVDGTAFRWYTKAGGQIRVRPVSAFLL